MRIARRTVVALAASAATVFGLAAPASAATDDAWLKNTVAYGAYDLGAGRALFNALGENLHIYDFDADGAGVRVYYSYNGGSWYYRTNTQGAGSTLDVNLDYPENKSFEFFVCVEDEGVTIGGTCSATVAAHT